MTREQMIDKVLDLLVYIQKNDNDLACTGKQINEFADYVLAEIAKAKLEAQKKYAEDIMQDNGLDLSEDIEYFEQQLADLKGIK